MKPEFISISRFAIIATMAGSLSVIGTIRAQEGKEDTGIGSNPHLRSKSAGTSPASTVTVKLSQKDVNFIQKAAGGGQQEVENGKMAEKQGKSADGKRIGGQNPPDDPGTSRHGRECRAHGEVTSHSPRREMRCRLRW